jgi:hypothetical protein
MFFFKLKKSYIIIKYKLKNRTNMEEYNIDEFTQIIAKNNILEVNLNKILFGKYFFTFIKDYVDESAQSLEILEEHEDSFEDFLNLIYKILSVYILLISQVYIFKENNPLRIQDKNYIFTIYLMYCDHFTKNKILFNDKNLFILYQTYEYFQKYKYSNNNFYLVYKRFISLYNHLFKINQKNININHFFQKNIILDNLDFEIESFLI